MQGSALFPDDAAQTSSGQGGLCKALRPSFPDPDRDLSEPQGHPCKTGVLIDIFNALCRAVTRVQRGACNVSPTVRADSEYLLVVAVIVMDIVPGCPPPRAAAVAQACSLAGWTAWALLLASSS